MNEGGSTPRNSSEHPGLCNVECYSADTTPALRPSLTQATGPAHLDPDWTDSLSRCGHVCSFIKKTGVNLDEQEKQENKGEKFLVRRQSCSHLFGCWATSG